MASEASGLKGSDDDALPVMGGQQGNSPEPSLSLSLSLSQPLGPRIDDARGLAIHACWMSGLRRGAVAEILERDDGVLFVLDMAEDFAPFPQWRGLHRWACDRARGRVLDLGAGSGSHALHLQQTGTSVLALDVSPMSIEVCKLRGIVDARVGSHEDILESHGGSFDTILMLGSGLGMLQDPRQGKTLLGDLSKLLSPGGRIIGEGFAEPVDPSEGPEGPQTRLRIRNDSLGHLFGQASYRYRWGATATPWFEWLHPTKSEAGLIFASAGFRLVEVIEEGNLYVIVAQVD